MPQATINQVLVAYRDLADWLLAHADELEAGERKVVAHMRGHDIDLTPNYVAEYRHKAHNLLAILEAYERIRSHEPRRPGPPSPSP
jgi:hypothetical protein